MGFSSTGLGYLFAGVSAAGTAATAAATLSQGAPKIPPPPAPPPPAALPPAPDADAIAQARSRDAAVAAARSGRLSTILTDTQGTGGGGATTDKLGG